MTGNNLEELLKLITRIKTSKMGVSDNKAIPSIRLNQNIYTNANDRYKDVWDTNVPNDTKYATPAAGGYTLSDCVIIIVWLLGLPKIQSDVGKDNIGKLVEYATEHTVWGRKEIFGLKTFRSAGWDHVITQKFTKSLIDLERNKEDIANNFWNRLSNDFREDVNKTTTARNTASTAAVTKATAAGKTAAEVTAAGVAAAAAVPIQMMPAKFDNSIKVKIHDIINKVFVVDNIRDDVVKFMNYAINKPLKNKLLEILKLSDKKQTKKDNDYSNLPIMLMVGGNDDIRGEFEAYKNTIASEKNSISMIGGSLPNIWAPGLNDDATQKSKLFLEAYNTIVAKLNSNGRSLTSQDDKDIRDAIKNLAKRESSLYGLLQTLIKYNQLLEKFQEGTDMGDKIRNEPSMLKAVSTYFRRVSKIRKAESKLLTVFGEIVNLY